MPWKERRMPEGWFLFPYLGVQYIRIFLHLHTPLRVPRSAAGVAQMAWDDMKVHVRAGEYACVPSEHTPCQAHLTPPIGPAELALSGWPDLRGKGVTGYGTRC